MTTKTAVNHGRSASIERVSKETQIEIEVKLDQAGLSNIQTPLPFFTHMLDTFACHSQCSFSIQATGDIEVDPHHLIEDCGIVLGQAIFKALNGLGGIQRAGSFSFPMDGSLAMVSLDLCGRRNLMWNVEFSNFPIGNLDPNLFREFFKGFVDGLRATIHVNVLYRDNDHHVIEAVFKALARALRQAITPLECQSALSTKGMFDEE